MEINLNFEELSPEDRFLFLDKISFEVFYALFLAYCKEKSIIDGDSYAEKELHLLENAGFIKIISDDYNFALLEKAETLFGKKLDSLTELASKLIEIYPQGVKSGGYPVRGRNSIINKNISWSFNSYSFHSCIS